MPSVCVWVFVCLHTRLPECVCVLFVFADLLQRVQLGETKLERDRRRTWVQMLEKWREKNEKWKWVRGGRDWQARRGWDHSLTAPCSNYNILCWVCAFRECVFFVCVTVCICISGPVQGILDSVFAHWIMHQPPYSQHEIALCSSALFSCCRIVSFQLYLQ